MEPKEKTYNWPDEVRLKMVERSNFYLEPHTYQYGFYDGYQYAAQETAQLMEALKELIEYFEKSEYEKSLVKYDDFRDKIENARKLTNQP